MSALDCGCPIVNAGPSLANTCSANSFVTFMTLVDVFVRFACPISDPCGRVVPNTQPDRVYDFVVIGAGSGGSTAAGRLADNRGWNVLLLEAGWDEPPGSQVPAMISYLGSSIDWNFQTEPEPVACQSNAEQRCTWPRGKVLGGCSVFNGMMYMRGTRKDYERWVEAGNDQWSYDDLLPVFKRSEGNRQIGELVDAKYHGANGPFTIQRFNDQPDLAWDVLAAADQVGYPVSNDLNGDIFNGFAVAQANNRDGARLSTAKAFVRPHKNSPNFDVMMNSTVTKIIVEQVNGIKRATGVQFVYNNQTFTVNVSKEVILAAGAVQTPQVLLLSGIGDKAVLDSVGIEQVHNLTGVGKGLQNHVSFNLPGSIDRNSTALLNDLTLAEYLSTGRGPLSSTGMSQVTARLNSRYSPADDPDIQLFFNGYSARCAYDGTLGSPENPDNPDAKRSVSIAPVNLHPKSKGSITLKSSDPFDHPKIVANYLTEEDDVRTLVEAIRAAQKLASAPLLKEKYNFQLSNTTNYGNCSTLYTYDSDEFWSCAVKYATSPENHQGSSCKMGPASNPETCVNQQLQLHGIENIRITDASVFPTLPSGNTQATIVAIAERAVEFISRTYS
ncbi:glucose dehydrogenase [FAD, quinone]-like [Cylas formicarius]|uniref:glucose dehydrogenase [FAD, quinone]-like n=1 Tax=Cylas formicarius TaxID=197179 RepID=UPI002958B418|nr:glucose dehydrogenase [FAD, quinone]-like [Cylas formicarius]XP_060524996.1 glucose dehydrogenase [FAD, quinone]-like [Cylas formicarius]